MKNKIRIVVISLASACVGAIIGAALVNRITREKLDDLQSRLNKNNSLFRMMNQWVRVKQDGKNIATYLENKGYKRIAVYGMSYAGETLVDELKGTSVEVAYGIDKRSVSAYSNVEIYSVDDELVEVDAVVVTAITYFDEIKETLSEKIGYPIVSLEYIIDCI
jgi:hypothetical protein